MCIRDRVSPTHPEDDVSDAAPPADDKATQEPPQLWTKPPDRTDSEPWSPCEQAAARGTFRDRHAPGDPRTREDRTR
eukprot:3706419-Pyramimonas_sp.AAC.1